MAKSWRDEVNDEILAATLKLLDEIPKLLEAIQELKSTPEPPVLPIVSKAAPTTRRGYSLTPEELAALEADYRMFSIPELAAMTHQTPAAIKKLIRRGSIRASRVGQSYKVQAQHLRSDLNKLGRKIG